MTEEERYFFDRVMYLIADDERLERFCYSSKSGVTTALNCLDRAFKINKKHPFKILHLSDHEEKN